MGFWSQRDVFGFHRAPVVVHALSINCVSDNAAIIRLVLDAVFLARDDGKQDIVPGQSCGSSKYPSRHRGAPDIDRFYLALADDFAGRGIILSVTVPSPSR